MVTAKSVEKQLKHLKFNLHSWGRAEIRELPNILMPDEAIFECVNGIYEGGFALLVATDSRVLLVDKKPLNYLTVEDMRYDMINELDYNHRLIGAQISISAGSKNLKFKSYNQPRLRKLITHVQHSMAEGKKQESAGQKDQKQHLEQINQQLQAYLIAQHQQQQALREQLAAVHDTAKSKSSEATAVNIPEAPKVSPELADFLFAQSLLKQYREQEKSQPPSLPATTKTDKVKSQATEPVTTPSSVGAQQVDLFDDGVKEIFGRNTQSDSKADEVAVKPASATGLPAIRNALEVNPLSIAYSKLPMALRNRKFGRPSYHAHSQQQVLPAQPLSTT